MDDVIRLLPESVYGRIAAGEVVQRPSSVVKEMMENSIDAYARNIRVLLLDAGRTSIQVIDDGCGMSASDALTAFKRHATSKITSPEDLYALSTFGFRGEALASIAAVSEVQLRTRRAEDETGIQIEVRGEEIISREPVMCPVGCNFTVKNLFYNLPARRKFLKGNQTELSNIIKEVERVALAHPELSISVTHQDTELLDLPASNLKQRIIGLFGKGMNKQLIPVSTETSAVIVSGLVGTLDGVRKRGAEQFFFVNGRYMRHPYFHKAVMEPYESLVPAGEQPSYFIFLEVPADTIDVNIHPTKTEIKFSEEQLVWKIINAAVREAVGRFEGTPTIDFDTEGMPDIPIAVNDVTQVQQPKVNFNPSYNPFHSTGSSIHSSSGAGNGNWSKLYDDILSEKVRDGELRYQSNSDTPQTEIKADAPAEERPCFQMNGGYIVTSSDGGLMVVSQRRAHIAVLYNDYVRQLNHDRVASQGLLFPEMIQLSPSDYALLPEYESDLNSLGFDISDMGHNAVAIQGTPAGMENVDFSKLLIELFHAADDGTALPAMKRIERMALSMARNAAITDVHRMSQQEMRELLTRLEQCGLPRRTPDGKSILTVFEPPFV